MLTFCSRLSPTRAAQRLHAGACWYTVVLRPIVSHKAAQGQHGGISLRVLQGTATFFSADKVGPGFRLEAVLVAVYRSQTFCLFFS